MWLGSFMSCPLFLVSSVLVGRERVRSNFQNLLLIAKPVYSKCFDNICKPKEIEFTAKSPCVFPSINDELIYRRIFADSTENSFQAFGHGKCAKRLYISISLSPHQLQGLKTYPELCLPFRTELKVQPGILHIHRSKSTAAHPKLGLCHSLKKI